LPAFTLARARQRQSPQRAMISNSSPGVRGNGMPPVRSADRAACADVTRSGSSSRCYAHSATPGSRLTAPTPDAECRPTVPSLRHHGLTLGRTPLRTERADAKLNRAGIEDSFARPMVCAVRARTVLHRGDIPAARRELVRAQGVRSLLTYALPHMAAQARIELAWLSSSTGFSHEDLFIFGAVHVGVEQHQVAAPGAFDPDGTGQIIIAILAEGGIATGGGNPAGEQEHRRTLYAERVRRAAHGASPQAELLKRLGDLGDETLTPSHELLYLHPTRAQARRRSQGRCGITASST
jgi:hypothetical protein